MRMKVNEFFHLNLGSSFSRISLSEVPSFIGVLVLKYTSGTYSLPP